MTNKQSPRPECLRDAGRTERIHDVGDEHGRAWTRTWSAPRQYRGSGIPCSLCVAGDCFAWPASRCLRVLRSVHLSRQDVRTNREDGWHGWCEPQRWCAANSRAQSDRFTASLAIVEAANGPSSRQRGDTGSRFRGGEQTSRSDASKHGSISAMPVDTLTFRNRSYDFFRARHHGEKPPTRVAPWFIVRSDNNRTARLNTIAQCSR